MELCTVNYAFFLLENQISLTSLFESEFYFHSTVFHHKSFAKDISLQNLNTVIMMIFYRKKKILPEVIFLTR